MRYVESKNPSAAVFQTVLLHLNRGFTIFNINGVSGFDNGYFCCVNCISSLSAVSYLRFLLPLLLYQTSTKVINLFGSTIVALHASGRTPSTNSTATTTTFVINHGAGINHASESHRKICISEKEADGGALT